MELSKNTLGDTSYLMSFGVYARLLPAILEPSLPVITLNAVAVHICLRVRVNNSSFTHVGSKRAGEDKKLSKLLEQQYAEEVASSPSLLGSSPLGPLSESTTRRLLIDLISTMNASFPDHDFSSLRPDQFTRETNVHQVE